ncbi:hypothetical protein J437_LFUL010337 [Ladona fulva]|uniref:Galactokinase n=1 Tax=Ladona fulva TaxID=123851 RepID=A0A8K0NXT0_LADFU|nr:hypothetical protein J437_LFUL010337 [Ladona fulva]
MTQKIHTAVPQLTVVAGSFDPSGKITIVTNMRHLGEPNRVIFDHKTNLPGKPIWANYVKGVVKNFPGGVPGFCAVVVSSVPAGGGLASSAALEVAMFTFLEALTGDFTAKPPEKSLLCQKAEHEYVGVPCGIMDQYASIFGTKGKAILLDCRAMVHDLIPFEDRKIAILLTNSNVVQERAESEYPVRRKECNQAAEYFNRSSLPAASDMPPLLFKRARHVISEIARTKEAAEALRKQNYEHFGKLMQASHESLRDDFEVSCEEINQIVALSMDYSQQHDDCVYGCRITGLGFGGCTISLVIKDELTPLMAYVKGRYQYSPEPSFTVVKPSYGARILRTSFATIE